MPRKVGLWAAYMVIYEKTDVLVQGVLGQRLLADAPADGCTFLGSFASTEKPPDTGCGEQVRRMAGSKPISLVE